MKVAKCTAQTFNCLYFCTNVYKSGMLFLDIVIWFRASYSKSAVDEKPHKRIISRARDIGID